MPQLYFVNTKSEGEKYARQAAAGSLRRIRKGIYTDASNADIPAVVEREWHKLVGHLVKDAVVSHRTASELKPHQGRVYVTAEVKARRYVRVGTHLVIDVMPGDTHTHVVPFLNVKISDNTRMLLENLAPSRAREAGHKTMGREWVEHRLVRELGKGEQHLNQLRDEARQAADTLGLEREYDQLSGIISSLMNTYPDGDYLTTPLARAQARKKPYDGDRLQAFEVLANYLMRCSLEIAPFSYQKAAWRNLSFFESYFSNFIEGTEFEVDEAEKIIFNQQIIANRSADSHDILSVYDMVNDYSEMTLVPETASEFLGLLQDRHQRILYQRPDKNSGQFKTLMNRAGGTQFVSPEHLAGTLTQGFQVYQSLPKGFARALFMQFLISECHPFDDGNGRLSRIFLNAELVSQHLCKIMVPTVSRDNYLNALRRASRDNSFRLLVRVFWQLQRYTASIDWMDYDEALSTLEYQRATRTADEGIGFFNRHLPKLTSPLPVS